MTLLSRRLLLFALLAIVAVIAYVALSFASDDDGNESNSTQTNASQGCTPTEQATATAAALLPTYAAPNLARISPDELNRQIQEERAKPRYTGRLCDFQLVATADEERASFAALCGTPLQGRGEDGPPNFVASELNKPGITSQVLCENMAYAVYSATGRRSYYLNAPVVYVDAPRERLEVVDVDGHAALIVAPPAGAAPLYRFFAIQRSAADEQTGIMVAGGMAPTRDQTIAAIRAAFAERAP